MLGKEAMGWRATNKPAFTAGCWWTGTCASVQPAAAGARSAICVPAACAPSKRGSPFGAGCGRPLYVACPFCGKPTFVQERCEQCGQGLLVRCGNKRCGAAQFFENTRCTACGKKIKAKIGNR